MSIIISEDQFLTQTQVKEKGFTDKMIKDLLPQPILKPNPIYKSASPMKLWKAQEVEEVMKSDAFAELQSKSARRREGAQKAVATKTAKLKEEIDLKIQEISVKKIDSKKLLETTLNEKQSWYNYQADLRNNWDESRTAEDADEATKRRWMVNYIRHNLTTYDKTLYEMSGKVGCHQEYSRYRNEILNKIAEIYPQLQEECKRQQTRI